MGRSPRRAPSAPHSPSAPEADSSITTDNTVDTVPQPHWNTSKNELPGFASDALYKWLAKQDTRYVTFVRYGYVISGKYTICASLNHIDRICDKSVKLGTFA